MFVVVVVFSSGSCRDLRNFSFNSLDTLRVFVWKNNSQMKKCESKIKGNPFPTTITKQRAIACSVTERVTERAGAREFRRFHAITLSQLFPTE